MPLTNSTSPTGAISAGPSLRYIERHSRKTVETMLWPNRAADVVEQFRQQVAPALRRIPEMMVRIDDRQMPAPAPLRAAAWPATPSVRRRCGRRARGIRLSHLRSCRPSLTRPPRSRRHYNGTPRLWACRYGGSIDVLAQTASGPARERQKRIRRNKLRFYSSRSRKQRRAAYENAIAAKYKFPVSEGFPCSLASVAISGRKLCRNNSLSGSPRPHEPKLFAPSREFLTRPTGNFCALNREFCSRNREISAGTKQSCRGTPLSATTSTKIL